MRLHKNSSPSRDRAMQIYKWLVGAAAFFCLGGCMKVGPNYHPPETKMPDTFIASSSETQKSPENNGNQPVIDAATWWQALDDQELNSLIDRAIKANPDIGIALYRLQEAREQEVIVMGGALPFGEASGGGGWGNGSDLSRGRAPNALYSSDNAKVPVTYDVKGKKTTTTVTFNQVTDVIGFDFRWELDLWGKYRRAIEAAKYDTQAAIEIHNYVLISVIADVARAYVDMRAYQMQLAVLLQNIDVAREYLDLTQKRFDNGITNELDLTLAKRQFATLQAQKMPLVEQIHAAQNVLAVFLGQFPEDLVKELEKPAMIPPLPEKIQAGLPLDLLRRRPDIRAVERTLAGATARIGVAEGDLFPHVSIVGSDGWQQLALGQTAGAPTSITTSVWSFGPSAGWALLDFGALDALVEIADLRTCEALLLYKKTVLNAVSDVDTSIGSYAAQQERLRSLGEALTASQLAVSLATQRYDRGLTDALNVVDAERQEYDLEAQYVLSQKEEADQFIALYKALGGGWEQYQSFPPVRTPLPAVLAAFKRLTEPDETKKCEWVVERPTP